MNTLTMARIYEKQGHVEDAMAIYKELLRNDPKNSTYKKAILRLSDKNYKKVAYFTAMHTKEHFDVFQRWLVKPWS